MATYGVKINGLKELIKAMNDAPSIVKPILQDAVVASGAVFASKTLKGDPIPWRTGNLLMSFRFMTEDLVAKWYPTAYYSVFVHDGTRRGIKGNPFMPKVADRSREKINSLFKDASKKVTNTFSKRAEL